MLITEDKREYAKAFVTTTAGERIVDGLKSAAKMKDACLLNQFKAMYKRELIRFTNPRLN